MHSIYLEFTDLFSRLSPYQLNHLSEMLICKIEDSFGSELSGRNRKSELTEKDIKYALTEAMRDIALELRERQISHEHLKLDQTRSMMFSHKKVAA